MAPDCATMADHLNAPPSDPLDALRPALSAIVARFQGGADDEGPALIAPLGGGLINDTWAVGSDRVLQRLHPIFAATVNDDIAALTPVLRAAGVPVPALLPTRSGASCVVVPVGESADPRGCGVFRMLTRLPGRCHAKVASPAMAGSAAALLARFHGALADCGHRFAFVRPGAHDTDRHVASVGRALSAHPDHRLAAEVRELERELSARWASAPRLPDLPERIIHGDPKISNLLFDDAGEAIGILDLDTMARSTLDIELGDALRSWCNRSAEDETAILDIDVFAAALEGYAGAAGASWTQAEAAAALPGLWRIALELSARFAADAIAESYFGWDPQRARARGEHNLMRARGQLSLVRAVEEGRPRLQAIANRAASAASA